MYRCPSCHSKGIRLLAQWWSWPSLPAKCRRCGEFCSAPVRDSGVVLVLSAVGVTASGFASIVTGSVVPVVLAVLAAIAATMWKWHRQVPVPLTIEQVAHRRKLDSLSLVAVLLFVFFQ